MCAWNNWYHCCGNTYGTWLLGDPKGWRSYKHRLHCEGDYKNPPPKGKHDALYERSKRLMTRARVVLNPEQREVACRTMVEALLFHKVEVIDFCVSGKHWHALTRFHPLGSILTKDRMGRRLMGIAKKVSARALSDAQLADRGGVWGRRCLIKPVKDRKHQLCVARYIPAHAKKGAVVYSLLLKRDRAAVPTPRDFNPAGNAPGNQRRPR